MADTKRELFAQLLECTKDWNQHDFVPEEQQAECKRIGVALNRLGGMELMLAAYYEAKAENFHVHAIQAYWDRIGDWRW